MPAQPARGWVSRSASPRRASASRGGGLRMNVNGGQRGDRPLIVENVVIRALCGNARTGEPVSRLRGDDGLYARNPSKPDEDRPSRQRMIALASARARDRSGGRSYKMTAAKPRTVQALTQCSGDCSRPQSNEPRRVLPSMATTSRSPGAAHVPTQFVKQDSKACGSIRMNTRRNVSWEGMPLGQARNWRNHDN